MRKYSGSSRCQPFKGSWRRHAAVTLQKGVAPKRTTKKSCMLRSDERQHLQNQGNPRYIFPPNPPSQNPRGCSGEMYIDIASDSPSTARQTRQGKSRWESGFATPQRGVLQRGRRKVQSKMKKVQLHYCRNQEKAVPLHPANPDKPYGENLRRVTPL